VQGEHKKENNAKMAYNPSYIDMMDEAKPRIFGMVHASHVMENDEGEVNLYVDHESKKKLGSRHRKCVIVRHRHEI
jgi:hypothetical protein